MAPSATNGGHSARKRAKTSVAAAARPRCRDISRPFFGGSAAAAHVCLVSLVSAPGARAQQATPVRTTAATPPPIEDVLKAARNDLQGTRAEVIAKNVTLTSEQAAKFWPMFEKYQQQQNVIMDEQLKGLQQYVDNFDRLDDAGALALLNRISSATRVWWSCGSGGSLSFKRSCQRGWPFE
jgi:Spy/CpxP family protein refolding chaperone